VLLTSHVCLGHAQDPLANRLGKLNSGGFPGTLLELLHDGFFLFVLGQHREQGLPQHNGAQNQKPLPAKAGSGLMKRFTLTM